jgi:hypothetical protein
MKKAVFWVVTPCSLVEVYRRFRGACCLHHQGDDRGATNQKTAIFSEVARKTRINVVTAWRLASRSWKESPLSTMSLKADLDMEVGRFSTLFQLLELCSVKCDWLIMNGG